jgi:hypothetical protein
MSNLAAKGLRMEIEDLKENLEILSNELTRLEAAGRMDDPQYHRLRKDQIPAVQRLGYHVWNVTNNEHAASYLQVTSSRDGKFTTVSSGTHFLITKLGITKATYLESVLCVIECQSNSECCELQIQMYMLRLMKKQPWLPGLLGFLVLDNGQRRGFKATRHELGGGGGIFEMNEMFHVRHLPAMMDRLLKDWNLVNLTK